ncbi:unnamed protein product [Cuscuta campestris]|uniref:Uncharacterized protein n=1 Tax=Cuscuta campestris TaxID=132261 RepID=A0A484N1X2_9ASTE|nr:unnamed protein product [Cuscuta campestris]
MRAIRVYFVPKWAKGGDSMEIVFHDEHIMELGFMHILLERKKRSLKRKSLRVVFMPFEMFLSMTIIKD